MEAYEAYTYTYDLLAGDTHLHVIILVESDPEPDRPNHYTFTLSIKIGPVERTIAQPVTMTLSIDPRRLDFVVFAFSPRSSLPVGCLYHLRVWLRVAGVDHRLFSEKDLWFGRDPDFGAIPDASFAALRNVVQDMSIYQATVGRAPVSFVLRWALVEPAVYALSLAYEAGGVGKTLFENYRLRLACAPRALSFLLYAIPVPSTPPGSAHRLRLWLRLRAPTLRADADPNSETHVHAHVHARAHVTGTSSRDHVYYRLWKSDDFRIGGRLDFESVAGRGDRSHVVFATRAGVVVMTAERTANAHSAATGTVRHTIGDHNEVPPSVSTED